MASSTVKQMSTSVSRPRDESCTGLPPGASWRITSTWTLWGSMRVESPWRSLTSATPTTAEKVPHAAARGRRVGSIIPSTLDDSMDSSNTTGNARALPIDRVALFCGSAALGGPVRGLLARVVEVDPAHVVDNKDATAAAGADANLGTV